MEYRNVGRSGLRVSEISVSAPGSPSARASTARHARDRPARLRPRHQLLRHGRRLRQRRGRAGARLRLLADPASLPRDRHQVLLPDVRAPERPRPLAQAHRSRAWRPRCVASAPTTSTCISATAPTPTTPPIEETVCAYEDLIRQGKVLYWGVSEWRAAQIEDACRVADASAPTGRSRTSRSTRSCGAGSNARSLPACEREGVGQVVFSPLAQGVLSGKYSGGARPGGTRAATTSATSFMNAYLEPDALARVDALEPMAAELGLSMAQLALAWCLRRPGVASVIVGATRTCRSSRTTRRHPGCGCPRRSRRASTRSSRRRRSIAGEGEFSASRPANPEAQPP